MLNRVDANSASLNVFINVAMLLVWFVYLHLLLTAYLRQRKPKILINRGAGIGMNAHCLISNMSQEPIYVQSILAVLKTEDRSWMMAVTDVESLDQETGDATGKAGTNQGPLSQGHYMDIGTLGNLVERTRRATDLPDTDDPPAKVFKQFEIVVVAAHGPDNLAIGAKRSFRFHPEAGSDDIVPETVETKQISSPWERRKIHRLLHEHL